MEIKFNKDHMNLIQQVAEEYGVNAELLEDMYRDIMYNNFYQDLHDIARENENELKGE